MSRPPVRLVRGWTPGRASAWVPRPRTVVLGRDATPTVTLVVHELSHVRQFEERGIFMYLAYVVAILLSRGRHSRNWLEDRAREAERDPAMRAWAEEVMTRNDVAWRS